MTRIKVRLPYSSLLCETRKYTLPQSIFKPVAGIILAYSNSVAGRLSDMSIRANSGNIGCFLGGTVATLLSAAALILFTQFGSLGKEDALIMKPKKA